MRIEVRNIPIIALTADASEKEKVKAREAGMNDYVVKPYTPEELFSTLLKFLPENNTAEKHRIKREFTPCEKIQWVWT
ncbi:MAG: response regulator [Saprospiraceae bacterium]|nr:response regulator [Candidatus Brachybacter algidus]